MRYPVRADLRRPCAQGGHSGFEVAPLPSGLLLRQQAGGITAEITLIIGNHEETGLIAQSFGIPFRYFPITAGNKPEREAAEIRKIKSAGVDL